MQKLADIFYNTEAITCCNDMEHCYFNYGGQRGREEFEQVSAHAAAMRQRSHHSSISQSSRISKRKLITR